jgi:hypothetical protein
MYEKNAVFWDVALCRYLHGATSQKTVFFIVTAVKTSKLTICEKFIILCKNHEFKYNTKPTNILANIYKLRECILAW